MRPKRDHSQEPHRTSGVGIFLMQRKADADRGADEDVLVYVFRTKQPERKQHHQKLDKLLCQSGAHKRLYRRLHDGIPDLVYAGAEQSQPHRDRYGQQCADQY